MTLSVIIWKECKPNGKEYSQSMRMSVAFCSTSSTNEVTGFRAETADTWSGVKSKADGRITTEATIPRVISSMKFYYGTRQE